MKIICKSYGVSKSSVIISLINKYVHENLEKLYNEDINTHHINKSISKTTDRINNRYSGEFSILESEYVGGYVKDPSSGTWVFEVVPEIRTGV